MTAADDLRREAEDILSRREFQDPERSIADRTLGWIGDRLADLFDRIGGLLPGGNLAFVSWLIFAGVVALLAYVLAKVVTRPTIERRARRAPLRASLATELDAAYWQRRAEQARAEGDFAEAVRCHYRAGAQRLIEAGRAPDAPGITVKGLEHRVEARDDRELLALRSVSDAFEEVWYGGRDADADLADTVGQDARRVGVTATVDETGSS